MKTFLSFLLAATMLFVTSLLPTHGHAQIVKQLTIAAADDTLTNADTAVVSLSLDASYKSVEAQILKVSGTGAGTIVLQGKLPDGSNWADLDTYTITNVADQQKLFTLPNPRLHAGYRLKIISSGTTVLKPLVYTLRYTGG